MLTIYCLTASLSRESGKEERSEPCSKQGLARECFVFLPSAQMRQLLPRSCVRIRRVVLSSELDPVGAWLSLAGSCPCGFCKVSPDVGGGSSGRRGLRPGHSGASY